MKESFVYHAAGVAGRGGSSYIDSVILRDKDANTGWTSAADGTLEDRVFYAQNWRADVVAITKSDGQPTEFIRYTSYGTAQAFTAADVNRDGTVNSADSSDWNELYTDSGLGNAAIPVDFDFDGSSFNPDDLDAFNAAYTEASGWSNGGLGAGGGKLSRIGNRKGYAGYEYDHSVVAYHVRHRVYVPEIGRWTKRDPLGYVDGTSLWAYIGGRPIFGTDSLGLFLTGCSARPNNSPPGCTINDPGNLTDSQACDAMRTTCGAGDGGGVICHKGKTVSCNWSYPGTPSIGQKKVQECIIKHEDDHHDSVNCVSCPSGQICRPNFKPSLTPKDIDKEECSAYNKEIKCLLESRKECNKLPTAQALDCLKYVSSRLKQLCDRNSTATKHCGGTPKGCQ